MADMWQSIKNFFKKPIVWAGLAVAAAGSAVAASVAYLNDFTRPPIPAPGTPRDYSADLQRLDSSKPVGVLLFNVRAHGHPIVGETGERMVTNAVRNNFIQDMRQHYGDNIIIVDDAPIGELHNFSRQFNQRFSDVRPEVHFVANHHQGTYDDRQLAGFLQSIEASSKRALVMSCGPVSEAYRNVPGFDYIIIPRADGQLMGPELSLRIGPAYRDGTIGVMRNNANPQAIREHFDQMSFLPGLRDRLSNFGYYTVENGRATPAHTAPLVVTPPTGIPNRSGQASTNTPQ